MRKAGGAKGAACLRPLVILGLRSPERTHEDPGGDKLGHEGLTAKAIDDSLDISQSLEEEADG